MGFRNVYVIYNDCGIATLSVTCWDCSFDSLKWDTANKPMDGVANTRGANFNK